jgi:hypothetical protein
VSTETANLDSGNRMKFLRQRWLWSALIFCVLLLGIKAIHRALQPKYQGKTAQEWYARLDPYDRSSASIGVSIHSEDPAVIAFAHFGPETAQFLWQEYNQKDWPVKKTVILKVREWTKNRWIIDEDWVRQFKASCLLQAMGSQADCVMPELIQRAQATTGEERLEILRIIGSIGTRSEVTVPLLVSNLNTAHERTWGQCVDSLKVIGRPASNALPALEKELLVRTDDDRVQLAAAMVAIGDRSKLTHLLAEIQDTNSPHLNYAFHMLVALKTNAVDAIPALSTMTNDLRYSQKVWEMAVKSIALISPDPAKKLP